jgi:hypothetical protein
MPLVLLVAVSATLGSRILTLKMPR